MGLCSNRVFTKSGRKEKNRRASVSRGAIIFIFFRGGSTSLRGQRKKKRNEITTLESKIGERRPLAFVNQGGCQSSTVEEKKKTRDYIGQDQTRKD